MSETYIDELKRALQEMVYQFAPWNSKFGGFTTGGLSVLEKAFDILDWDEPHIVKRLWCEEPGCKAQATCGTPTKNGYRRTCYKHMPK